MTHRSESFPRTCEVLRSLGIDPCTVLATGNDETGYLVLGRHPEGRILPSESDEFEMSRVPWPSRDAWTRFQEAQLADGMMPTPPRVRATADAQAIEAAADWLDARREQTWDGGQRRPSNFGRAAAELRQYAASLREGTDGR